MLLNQKKKSLLLLRFQVGVNRKKVKSVKTRPGNIIKFVETK